MVESKMAVSVSVTNGDVAEGHTRRDYTPKSADRSLADRNVSILTVADYRDAWCETFAGSVERYNAGQKRDDRKKTVDAEYEDLRTGKRKEKPVYSTVLQLGSRDTLGVTDIDFDYDKWIALREAGKDEEASEYVQQHVNDDPMVEQAVKCLEKIGEGLPERYPALKPVALVIHGDEACGTPHLTWDWIPVAGGEDSAVFKNGMDTRCSLTKALGSMGFKTAKGKGTATEQFQNDVKAYMEEVMAEFGFERQYMNNTERHLSTDQFRRVKAAQAAERALVETEMAAMEQENRAHAFEAAAESAEDRREAAESERESIEIEIGNMQEDLALLDSDIGERRAILDGTDEYYGLDEEIEQKQQELADLQRRIDQAEQRGYDAGYATGREQVRVAEQKAAEARQSADERKSEYEDGLERIKAREGQLDAYAEKLKAEAERDDVDSFLDFADMTLKSPERRRRAMDEPSDDGQTPRQAFGGFTNRLFDQAMQGFRRLLVVMRNAWHKQHGKAIDRIMEEDKAKRGRAAVPEQPIRRDGMEY